MKTELIRQLLEAHNDEAMTDDRQCFEKALNRGQQTFTLVEQDRSSPEVIAYWILKNIETCPAEKLVDALLDALAMRDCQKRKNAD